MPPFQALVTNHEIGFVSVEDFDGNSLESLKDLVRDANLDAATIAILSRACRFFGTPKVVLCLLFCE